MKNLVRCSIIVWMIFLSVSGWTYNLSGTITDNTGKGIGSVTVSLSGDTYQSILTSQDGSFIFTGLAPGSYTVTPNMSGWKFTPGSVTCSIVDSDVTDITFTADKKMPEINILYPADGDTVVSNGTVTVKLEVKDFSLTVTDEGVAEGHIIMVLWKEVVVSGEVKHEPLQGFFWHDEEYTFKNLTPGTYTVDVQLADMFKVRLPAKASVTFRLELASWDISPVLSFTALSNNDSIILKWQNPPEGGLKGILILRDTEDIIDTPVNGSTYTVGQSIGSAEVIYHGTATSYNIWQERYTDRYNLTPDTTYHYAIFAYNVDIEYSPATKVSVTLSNIPPSKVVDLDSKYRWGGNWYDIEPTDHSIILTWSAPGGDGLQGMAKEYVIKYSTAAIPKDISHDEFMALSDVPGIIPEPSEAGSRQSMVVIDEADINKPFDLRRIQPETTYYFALKAYDGMSYSELSNVFAKATSDDTPPGSISDLAVVNPTHNSVMLVWTAPADDGTFTWRMDNNGRVDMYDIRYATLTLTEATWAYAKPVPNIPIPGVAGMAQVAIVDGLALDKYEYYFGIKSIDEHGNKSGLSNVVSVDTLLPQGITDLKVGSPTASTLELSWTAPGDNGAFGIAKEYDIRYSLEPITEANWDRCVEIWGEPEPLPAGMIQTFTITGLNFNTKYYIAMKVRDEAGNVSELSNVIYGITTAEFPEPPVNISAISGDTQLIVTWTPDDVPDVGGYIIYYGTQSYNGTVNKRYEYIVDAGNVATYTLTGLVNGEIYYISVRTYNTARYLSDYSMEITGEPIGMGYQFLPQSVIIPMGIQQVPTGTKTELDKLRNAYKAVFTHVKHGGNVVWTAAPALPYKGINYMRGTFISEFSTGSGTTMPTATAMAKIGGFDIQITEPGEGIGNVLGVVKSFSLRPIKIALFYSEVTDQYDQYITWEEGYFERLFRIYLWDAQEFDVVNETGILNGILNNYDMVIFPAVKKGYMDKIRARLGNVGLNNIKTFVEQGGFLYAQGESCYIAEMAGVVKQGTVDIDNRVVISDNIGKLKILNENNPIVFARLNDEMYVLDDPRLTEQEGQETVAKYINVAGKPPAIVCVKYGYGKVILMSGHPADKRKYYPLAINPILWAMGCKAGISCDGEQRFSEEVEKDIIPGLEPDVPVYVTITFSNFWNEVLQDVEVISVIQKGFKITDESNILPDAILQQGTDGTTILKWHMPSVSQGRLNFSYTVFTEADALKKGEAVVCKTKAIYTDGTRQITVHALPVKMRAKMAARLVGYRSIGKMVAYGISGDGIFSDAKFPIENKEDTEAKDVRIQDLVALVSPVIDPTNYRRIPSAVWNTNNGTNHCVWVMNEVFFYPDERYPLPEEAQGNRNIRFNIYNWDGKTTYVFEHPEGNDEDIVVPERYSAPVWGPDKNVPLIQKTEGGDLILPACKLVWNGVGRGDNPDVIQGYDYLEPAIRFGIRSIELPPDGVKYPRTILMKTLPNIPDKYIINGKAIMDARVLGFMVLLGATSVPYREVLAHTDVYIPRPVNPDDIPALTWKDIWNRPHTVTLGAMDPQFKKSADFFPAVNMHPSVNDTFELFDDKNNNNRWDIGEEQLFLEYDVTKKAKLHILIKTWNGSREFPEVLKPASKFDVAREQSTIIHAIFKGLGYNIEYVGYECEDLQGIGKPSQLAREFDTDMFHVLQFKQALFAGKRELIHVYANMSTYPDVHREGVMKVNEGTRYVFNNSASAGPNQYQVFDAHVQVVFGIGNNVEVNKKVVPVNIGNYGDTIYHIIKVEDPYEPRQFDIDPYIRSYGFGGLVTTIFVGGREKDKLHYSRLHPGESTIVRIEVCNNLGITSAGKAYHLENVKIEPDMATVPSWMTITMDTLLNTTPPIHGDLEYLLARQSSPTIHEAWKGVIYFKIHTDANIPEEDRGKVHKIRFILTCDDPDGKLDVYRNLPENKTKTLIPEAWIGIYDDQGRITTTYGKASIVTIKDAFPEFVKVKDAKLLTEVEKEIFAEKVGWDVDQYPRGTSSHVYFEDEIPDSRRITFVQDGSDVVFKLDSISDPAVKATTIPWEYKNKGTKTFYIVVKSKTDVVNSGIKMVNAGVKVEYKDYFNNPGTSASTAQTVVAHGPKVDMKYIIDGVRREFNQKLTKTLIMNEENHVEIRVCLSNEGDNIAQDTVGSLTLAADIEFVSAEPEAKSIEDRVIYWDNLGDLAPGSEKYIKLLLSVTPTSENTSPAPALMSPRRMDADNDNSTGEVTLIDNIRIKFKDAFIGTEVTPDPLGSLTIKVAPVLLTAPENLQAISNKGSITLTWTQVSVAKGYYVYRKKAGGIDTFTCISGLIIGTTTYVDKDMDEDVMYTYIVTAIDENNEESKPSVAVSAIPGDIWQPAAVELRLRSKTHNSVTIEWIAPGDNGNKGTATMYDLRKAISPDMSFESYTLCEGEPLPKKAGALQSMTISGLLPDTTYYFYLRSMDEANNYSELSNKLVVTTNSIPAISTYTQLYTGWNLYSLPLKPVDKKYNSQTLGEEINNQGGKCTIIQAWHGGAWKTRRVDLNIGNMFNIDIGKGYFLYCEKPSKLNIIGEKVRTQQIKLTPGWNLIGLPAGDTLTCKELGNDILWQDGTCTTIQAWMGGAWRTRRVDLNIGDMFDILPGRGYFVYCNTSCVYSPNRITVSNITHDGITISYVTDDKVTGCVRYGKDKNSLTSIAYDMYGETYETTKHYIVLENLVPNTMYYYDIITEGTVDDNNGEHYMFKTGAKIDTWTENMISGRVFDKDNMGVENAIVYVRVKDTDGVGSSGCSGWLSTRTDSAGVWQIDLGKVRTVAGDKIFEYSSAGDTIEVKVDAGGEDVAQSVFDTGRTTMLDMEIK